jgi:hypothetical protein
VPHWFFIYTLRVRTWAWGFRYFRFYPLRGRKPKAFAFPKAASMPLLGFGFASQTQKIIDAGLLPARLRRQSPSPAHTPG